MVAETFNMGEQVRGTIVNKNDRWEPASTGSPYMVILFQKWRRITKGETAADEIFNYFKQKQRKKGVLRNTRRQFIECMTKFCISYAKVSLICLFWKWVFVSSSVEPPTSVSLIFQTISNKLSEKKSLK